MNLIDEIIAAAADSKQPIGNLLRKCLILENEKPNEAFKSWLDKELDGYPDIEGLPPYRTVHVTSFGNFIGIMGRQLNSQPLTLGVLDKADFERMKDCHLVQPASSYEARPDESSDAQFPWNPALTAKYQTKFFKDSDFVLNRAWQLVPGSVLVSLLENVRNRVLRFALDLRKATGNSTLDSLSDDAVAASISKNIYQGKNLDWT
jgi:hypothetical protein